MLKEVHTITPTCIDNRKEVGCAEEIAKRLRKYLVQSAANGEGRKTFRVTFETINERSEE